MPKDIIKKFQKEYGAQRGKRIYYATANAQDRDPELFKKQGAARRRTKASSKLGGGGMGAHGGRASRPQGKRTARRARKAP